MRTVGLTRMLTATAGLGMLFGCNNYVDNSDSTAGGAGAKSREGAIRVASQDKVEIDVTQSDERLFDIIANDHGFSKAGLSDDETAAVVDYLKSFDGSESGQDFVTGDLGDAGQGIGDAGNPIPNFQHPGWETFNVSCARCHNHPDIVGGIQNGQQTVEPAPGIKIGP